MSSRLINLSCHTCKYGGGDACNLPSVNHPNQCDEHIALTEDEMMALLDEDEEDFMPIPLIGWGDAVAMAYGVPPVEPVSVRYPPIVKEHNKKHMGMPYKDSPLVAALRNEFETPMVCRILGVLDSVGIVFTK